MTHSEFDIATYGTSLNSHGWCINGAPADEITAEHLHDRTSVFDWAPDCCPLCSEPVTTRQFDDVADDTTSWHFNHLYSYHRCPRCAHWEFNGVEGGNKCMDSQQTVLVSSVAKKFAGNFPHECSAELAQHLRRNPKYWHRLDPTRMERLVADIFKANYCHSEVIHVGQPCDGGVDVYFIDISQTKWLIQVKRRERPNKSEGVATLRSILGTLVLENERHGMIVSTADSFSYFARKASAKAEQSGYTVKLIDKGVLDRMVGGLLPPTPWREIFSRPDLAHVSRDIQHRFWNPEDERQLMLF